MGAALVLALLVGANPALDEGRVMFHQLDYEHALVKLKSATEAAAPGAERREAYDLLARTWAALGDVKQAESVYAQLLAKDPLAPAPAEAAPKIRAAYSAAKSSLFPPGTVRLTRLAGPASKLKLELFDPWGVVTKLELHEQDGGRDKVKPLAVKPSVEATLGARTEQAYVVATNNKGELLASLGSRAKPLRFAHAEKTARAEPPPTPPPAVTAPDARPPPPEVQARQLLDEGRDADALQAVTSARAPGSLARDAVLALLGIEACASARLGDAEHAQLAYRRAFAMEPSLPAPDTCEEGWTAWFAARDASKHEPLELRALSLERTDDATKATVVRKADSLGLTRAVRFHLRRSGGWVDKEAAFEGERASVVAPPGVLGWWAEVLGEGGTVISLGSASAPLSPEGQPDAAKPEPAREAGHLLEEPPPPKRSGRLRGTVILGVIGVASLGVGSVLGVFAQQHYATLNQLPNTTVTSMSQRDSFGLYNQQRAEAVFATLFWCLAGALIVSAAAMFLFGSGGPL